LLEKNASEKKSGAGPGWLTDLIKLNQ